MAGQSDPNLSIFSAEEVCSSLPLWLFCFLFSIINSNLIWNFKCPGRVYGWRWNGGDRPQYENGQTHPNLCMFFQFLHVINPSLSWFMEVGNFYFMAYREIMVHSSLKCLLKYRCGWQLLWRRGASVQFDSQIGCRSVSLSSLALVWFMVPLVCWLSKNFTRNPL